MPMVSRRPSATPVRPRPATCASLELSLALHDLPDWMYEKYPDIDPDGFRRSRNPSMPWNVDSPNFKKLVETFINAVLPELAQCSNIAGYNLVNELRYADHNDYPAGEWHAFLRKRYFDIGQLNKAWGTRFTSFDEPAAELDSAAARKDFADFNARRVARFLQWESGLIHRYDSDTPCYANVPGARTEVIGVDKALLGEALDAQGADCSPRPVFTADGMEPDFSPTAWNPTSGRSPSSWTCTAPCTTSPSLTAGITSSPASRMRR